MKKIFFAVVALAAMSSCAKENTVMEAPRQAIAFGDVFVDNATRADYSDGVQKLTSFNVYGTVTGTANPVNIFDGDVVTGSVGNNVWNYVDADTKAEHWIPGADYDFAAVVDANVATKDTYGMPLTLTTIADANGILKDMLYAETSVNGDDVTSTYNTPVNFTFSHLLSKIGFSFTNGVTDNNAYTFRVNDVSFKNHDTEGTYTISTGKWDETITESTTALSFGAAGPVVDATKVYAPTTHQIIPGEQTLDITITYDILYKGETMSPNVTTTKELTHTFEKNKVYNIAVVLPAPGNAIEFKVTNDPAWDNNNVTIQ